MKDVVATIVVVMSRLLRIHKDLENPVIKMKGSESDGRDGESVFETTAYLYPYSYSQPSWFVGYWYGIQAGNNHNPPHHIISLIDDLMKRIREGTSGIRT